MSAGEFRRRACQTKQRLSKATLLAMLGPPPAIGEPYSNVAARAYFEKIENEWEITSFNSFTRIVCISISSRNGSRTVSVQLPPLISKK